ncbi:MAG: lactonase family protein [Geminicoccaceae bacterium]
MLLSTGIIVASVLASVLLGAPPFAEADDMGGALTQLDGEDGCVATDSAEGCSVGRALDGPGRVAVSRNGKNVYVASVFSNGGVAVFSRDRETGAITQLDGEDGCVNSGGAEDCAVGRALDGPRDLAISRDGKSIYIASVLSAGGVAVFSRDRATGVLTQLGGEDGCVNAAGAEGCAVARALAGPRELAVDRRGRNVYVASVSEGGGVGVFSRDRKTGVLTQLDGEDGYVNDDGAEGCAVARALSGPGSVTLSRDGKSVYIASQSGNAVAVFSRDRETGVLTQLDGEGGCINDDGAEGCAVGRALDQPTSVTVSRDGRNVYVVSFNGDAVAVFSRDRKSGALTQLDGEDGCVSTGGAEGCAVGRALDSPLGVTVSGDGRSVYVGSFDSNAVAVFSRDRKTGALTQLDGEDGCVGNDGADGCAAGRALDGPVRADVSQHDKSVYVSSGRSNAVAVFTRNRSRRR